MVQGKYIRTEEIKKKMRESRLGKKLSDEHKRKISKGLMGHRMSDKNRRRMIGNKYSTGQKIGFKHSEETKIKMSLFKKGKNKGKDNPFYGKTHSKETRKIMSENHVYQINSGCFKKGHKAWNDRGISSINKKLRTNSMWKIWRETVFLRDNFTCQNHNCYFCNNKIGAMLHPHHIKPSSLCPELVFNINNGITYCAEFHIKSGLHKSIQKTLMQKVV